jgi:hypothetical protein
MTRIYKPAVAANSDDRAWSSRPWARRLAFLAQVRRRPLGRDR